MSEFFVGVKSLVIYNRKTLLLKHSESHSSDGEWEYPGGAMIFGETIEETLKRKIKEETGLEIEIGKLVLAMTTMVGARQCVGLTYISRTNSDKVILSEEHTEYKWVNKAQLCGLLNKRMLDLLIENEALDTLEID